MKLLFVVATLLCALTGLGSANHLSRYPFSAVLLDDENGYYALYWNFNRSTETIYFAVNVSTTGWVGFGLSPDGQMTGSDVVIGWVAGDGTGYFHDRFAVTRSLPPIDTISQDWFLTSSREEGGFTFLEFYRNFTSCDPQDRNIDSSTARVVWSFNPFDPTSPNGEGAQYHGALTRGQRSLNLLGGLTGPAHPIDENNFLDVKVTNVTIPSTDTTYWCESTRLPSALIDNTFFITRISPRITQLQFVHHMLVYLCNNPLSEENAGASGPCGTLPFEVRACRGEGGLLVGAWAVGGEDFVYPDGIAFPIGGRNQESYVVLEMHYDNQGMVSGTVDNSGLRFFYTMDEPAQRAGIMFLGHAVTPGMIIPPSTRNFTVSGICSTECTSQFIPEDGIRIIGNNLHTHVVGRKVTLQQFRPNECGVLEEVAPIDQNLNYDFNFQQLVHLPGERLVLPGDLLVLNCEYDTTANSEFTLGGESTLEEMCLTFPVFYPKPAGSDILATCLSVPSNTSFNDFGGYLFATNPEAAIQLSTSNDPIAVLNGLTWGDSTELSRRLQDSVHNSTAIGLCAPESGRLVTVDVPPVQNRCPYEAADNCARRENRETCCERLGLVERTTMAESTVGTAGATQNKVHIFVLAMIFFIAAIL